MLRPRPIDHASPNYHVQLRKLQPAQLNEDERISVLVSLLDHLRLALDAARSSKDSSPQERPCLGTRQDLNEPHRFLLDQAPIHAQYEPLYMRWFASLEWTSAPSAYDNLASQYLTRNLFCPWLTKAVSSNKTARFALQLSIALNLSEMGNPAQGSVHFLLVPPKINMLKSLDAQHPFDATGSNRPTMDFLEHWQIHYGEQALGPLTVNFIEIYNALHGNAALPSLEKRAHLRSMHEGLYHALVQRVKGVPNWSMTTPLPAGTFDCVG